MVSEIKEVYAQVVRESLFAFAAVGPHDGQLDSLITPRSMLKMMALFLKEVSVCHAQEYILMVMDQAGRHIAKALEIPDNMRLIWLPP